MGKVLKTMRKVILIGDSIRQIGYGKKVPELLGPDYQVWQNPDNDRFSRYTLCNLERAFAAMPDPDVVHWNNGLWDSCVHYAEDGPLTPLDEYVSDMLKIARELKKRTPNVIFAKTTHCRPGYNHRGLNPDRNGIVDLYNAAIVPLLEREGVVINDLTSLVDADFDGMLREDNIHLSDRGIDVCAAQVVKMIKSFE